jgi:hypothetical protein
LGFEFETRHRNTHSNFKKMRDKKKQDDQVYIINQIEEAPASIESGLVVNSRDKLLNKIK